MDDVQKLKNELSELKEKYDKKIQELKKAKTKIKNLEYDVKWWDERKTYWYQIENKLDMLIESLPTHYYRVKFKAECKGGGILEYEELIKSVHPFLAEHEIKNREILNYKLIGIEKIT